MKTCVCMLMASAHSSYQIYFTNKSNQLSPDGNKLESNMFDLLLGVAIISHEIMLEYSESVSQESWPSSTLRHERASRKCYANAKRPRTIFRAVTGEAHYIVVSHFARHFSKEVHFTFMHTNQKQNEVITRSSNLFLVPQMDCLLSCFQRGCYAKFCTSCHHRVYCL